MSSSYLGSKFNRKHWLSVKDQFHIFGEYLLKFFCMLLLILSPVRSAMIAVGVLVVLDLLTGIVASIKEGKRITSRGFKKTVFKTLAYQSAIVVAFIMETYLLDGVPIVKVVTALIALTEGKSFFENVHRITGIDFWSEMLKKIREATSASLPDDKE